MAYLINTLLLDNLTGRKLARITEIFRTLQRFSMCEFSYRNFARQQISMAFSAHDLLPSKVHFRCEPVCFSLREFLTIYWVYFGSKDPSKPWSNRTEYFSTIVEKIQVRGGVDREGDPHLKNTGFYPT